MENIFLSWETLQRRGFIGPSICKLCLENYESTQHLFLDCAFTQELWNSLRMYLNYSGFWVGNNLIDCFKQWLAQNSQLPTLLALICWSIWRECNSAVFDDNIPKTHKVIHSSLLVLRDYKKTPKVYVLRLKHSFLDEGGTVGWFDGATSSTGLNSGAGGIIRINEQSRYKWLLNCGPGTNTRAELLGVWALLPLASHLSIQELHVLGDSKIIIDWLKGKGRLQVVSLDCWMDSISILINLFHNLSFAHVYRIDNQEANSQSKKALLKEPGKLIYYKCVGQHEGPYQFLDLY
jgi:ribonuclease HI